MHYSILQHINIKCHFIVPDGNGLFNTHFQIKGLNWDKFEVEHPIEIS